MYKLSICIQLSLVTGKQMRVFVEPSVGVFVCVYQLTDKNAIF
jgi:hypothetical protein